MILCANDGTLPLTRHALAACWRYRNAPDRDRECIAQWAGLSAEDCRALERLDANLHACPLPEVPQASDIPRYLAGTYLPAALDALAVSRHDARRLARAIAPPWLGAEETLMEALKNGWPAEMISLPPAEPKGPRPPCIRERLLEECARRGWEPLALPEGAVSALAEALEVLPQSVRTALRRLDLAAGDGETGATSCDGETGRLLATEATGRPGRTVPSPRLPVSPVAPSPSPSPAEPAPLGERIRAECARRGWEIGNLPRGATRVLAAALGAKPQTVGMVASVLHRNALIDQAMSERPPPGEVGSRQSAVGSRGKAPELSTADCLLPTGLAAAASVTHVMLEAGLESIANTDLRAEIRKLCLAVLAQVPLPKE